MRKAQKQDILDCIESLLQAHEEIWETLKQGDRPRLQTMLGECQEFAVSLGENIEKLEGQGHLTVSYLEEYCEMLFRFYESANAGRTDAAKLCKALKKLLLKIKSSAREDIHARLEIAFFPYKVSMWDSLESIYLAAAADPDCDAYCVPIPYYEMNPDHSFGRLRYEGDEYPEYVRAVDWETYRFEERKPDAIFIHNPYDNYNLVTSVHPRFYSENLRKYTDMLVYVPYYSTAGGMAESQKLCPAYINADYIVIQSPEYRQYFDMRLPDGKFLPLGSPKFDRVIRKCQNPPEAPESWKDKMEGRKVFFYNTGIGEMLTNTEDFLKKVRYVFRSFEGREDACLLWRPHPLLESTFDSMRPMYRQEYEALKRDFIERGLGIYDTTPDITDTVALCDAYIGDEGTSVTSLFGMAGKPVFLLNDHIHRLPEPDDWRGALNLDFNVREEGRWLVTQGCQLYVSAPGAYNYRYCCELSRYAYAEYYGSVYEIGGKLYVCPVCAQDILVAGEQGVEKRIELEKRKGVRWGFWGSLKYGRYLLLIPYQYPAVVRIDTESGKAVYFDEPLDILIKMDGGERKVGGCAVCGGWLYLASPAEPMLYRLHIESGRAERIKLPTASRCGCGLMVEREGELWLLPFDGETIMRWNPDTGAFREYTDLPEGFSCRHPVYGYECREHPFNWPAFYGEYLYLPPDWANMYVRLNVRTGEAARWQPPFEDGQGRGYFYTESKSAFRRHEPDVTGRQFEIWSYPGRRLYKIDLESNSCREIPIRFDIGELKQHEPGFSEISEWMRYACYENAFNSLEDFLDGKITGKPFDREKQLAAFREVASNADGTCGEKVYRFIKKTIGG